MNWEIRLALALMLLLCLLSLQACNQVPVIDKIEQQHEQEQVLEPVDNELSITGPTNFQGIANALGCVFAPNTCDNSK
jgi:hypothetical protein